MRCLTMFARFARFLGCASAAATVATSFAQSPTISSPLTALGVDSSTGVTRLALRPFELSVLQSTREAIVSGFPLSAAETIDLDVRHIDVFAPNATLVVVGPGGETPLPRPQGVILGGSVVGHPGSLVAIGFSGGAINGMIEIDGRTHLISNSGGAAEPIIYDIGVIPAGTIDIDALGCAVDDLPGAQVVTTPVAGAGGPGAPRGGPPCRHATMAIETDFDLLQQRFGGNQANCTAYISLLVAATSQIYERDVNTSLSISYLRLWSTADDPWDQASSVNQLYQFRDYWNLNMTSVDRTIAHMLSSRGLGGGVAWLSVLCHDEYGYAVDGNLAGSFPYPIQNNNSNNWDLMVFAHELGHNFGAPHTHNMTPIIDNCAGGDCSVVPNGTIMSYCHLCSGGLANVRMEFHSRTINEAILPYLDDNSGCDMEISSPTIQSLTPGRAVCIGTGINLQVTASGGGVYTYQWQKNGVDIVGATAATYAIPSFAAGSVGTYRVIVSNSCGSTNSNGIALTACTNQFDVNGDCATDLSDLAILLANFGGPGGRPQGDFNNSGTIDLTDLSLLLGVFGTTGCN